MKPDYHYVLDGKGETTGILLSPKAFEAYEEHMIDQEIVQSARDSKGEVERPLDEFLQEMRHEGEIDVYSHSLLPHREISAVTREKLEEPAIVGTYCTGN